MSVKPKCPCCDGSGKELNAISIGKRQRQLRITAGIGLRDLAKRLQLSHTYLTLLEQGKRKWTPQLVHDYLEKL
jgi:DNA-binding XRE family transcriptional regulator